MRKISGKFTSAKIYTDTVDEASIDQIQLLCDQEFAQDCKIRIMPDVHARVGCTIGTTMEIKDKVVPNLVGVDIGCGMATYVLEESSISLKKLDEFIHENIPAGTNIREIPHRYSNNVKFDDLICINQIDKQRAVHSMGTLGGGNHFIEVDQDEDGLIYLVVHSGSRYLGKQVAEYYQSAAWNHFNYDSEMQLKSVIDNLKKEGKHSEIPRAIRDFKDHKNTKISKSLAYLHGELFENYIHDMKIVQKYATLNRQAMIEDMIDALGLHVKESFSTIHNYIDTDAMILRKGAVSAKAGEKLLIPINMRDGSLICLGKGNPDWNYSAPHGAGRLFSRLQAKKNFSVEDYKKSMEGIYTTSVSDDTLDECPMAYKDKNEIMRNIEPTAEIIKIIKPLYNFKAGETSSFSQK